MLICYSIAALLMVIEVSAQCKYTTVIVKDLYLIQRRVCMQARVILLANACGTPRECE